jgi:hypothetical protein
MEDIGQIENNNLGNTIEEPPNKNASNSDSKVDPIRLVQVGGSESPTTCCLEKCCKL